MDEEYAREIERKYSQVIAIREKLHPALLNPAMAEFHKVLAEADTAMEAEERILHAQIWAIVDEVGA